MSAATFTPASGLAGHRTPSGATDFDDRHHRHLPGSALRAVKVFASAAFGVVVLGEYAEEVGVHRRQ